MPNLTNSESEGALKTAYLVDISPRLLVSYLPIYPDTVKRGCRVIHRGFSEWDTLGLVAQKARNRQQIDLVHHLSHVDAEANARLSLVSPKAYIWMPSD